MGNEKPGFLRFNWLTFLDSLLVVFWYGSLLFVATFVHGSVMHQLGPYRIGNWGPQPWPATLQVDHRCNLNEERKQRKKCILKFSFIGNHWCMAGMPAAHGHLWLCFWQAYGTGILFYQNSLSFRNFCYFYFSECYLVMPLQFPWSSAKSFWAGSHYPWTDQHC